MRFARLYNEVMWKPWLIMPDAHATIRVLLESKIAGNDAQTDFFGEPLPEMSVDNGIATIPIKGTILKGAGKIEKACGAVSTNDIAKNLYAALADESVGGIILDIDSPGGTVGGVAELGELIAKANKQKRVIAFTDGMMASAAYWLGAAADEIVATSTAEVGSIGVYLPWVDQTEAYAMEGLKVDLIKNTDSPLKGAGYPGTSLSPEQRADLQASVDDIGLMFKSFIRSARPAVKEEAMRGQTMMGRKAYDMGLVDGIGEMAEAIDQAQLTPKA